ncbi:MAG: sensor domain-containing phosphodiesterase [Sulfurospirillum sp.]
MKKTYKIYLNIIMMFLIFSLLISVNQGPKIISFSLLAFVMFILLLNLIRLLRDKENEENEEKNPKQAYLDAFENSSSLAKFNEDFTINYVNRSFCQLTLCSKDECLGRTLDDFLINQAEIKNEIYETLKYDQSWEGVLYLKIPFGEQVYIKCSIIPIRNDQNSSKEYLLIGHDLTELMIVKKVIHENTFIDSHTKLSNRMQLIKDKLNFNQRQNLTLIILNIDSFQAINSIYGNEFGDEVLVATAQWLKDNLPVKNSKLYKFEADVYAILIPFSYNKDELKIYLKSISKKITEDGLRCLSIDVNISFTIGAAQGKINLLKLSSIAYKEAKKNKKTYIIYDSTSNKEEEYLQNIKTINILKKSLKDDMVIPYYQPIMDVKTKKIDKYETLMRIKKENDSILSPYEFLEIAKHSKLYPSLSRSLIKKAFDNFKHSSNEFSINLSFLDILNQKTMNFILDILNEYDIGSWVVFEILESEGIDNYDIVLKFIEMAKSYGAKIAIDDFGSGYSNFERIVKLQPDYIKIDGSIIKNIDKNEDMRIISQTIVDFAQKLGVKTIAEYVHSKTILDIVTYMGVDYAQGYYIGKPAPRLVARSKNF